ncbi:MAG: diacylglycerol kinase [Flavobacteriaceae bacterium]|nr:diacylglycerol kinase [Flavobacteriaceae bacterium]
MKSKNSVLLVVNPVSGGISKEKLVAEIEREIANRPFKLSIYTTTGINDMESLKNQLVLHRPYRVLVLGGDGTIKLVADVLEGLDISLGILPAGSANGLATHFDLPDDREEQLEIALGAKTILADRLLVNGNVCLHLADLGINAELIKNYEQSQIRGKLGYILQSIPTLFQCEYPFSFSIEANGSTREKEGILLAIANATKFGTGANINPTGKIDDGKFELVLFKKLDIIEIIKTIQDAAEIDPDFAEIISTDRAVIRSKSGVPLQIDGEYMGESSKVEVKLCPDKLEIAVPSSFGSVLGT